MGCAALTKDASILRGTKSCTSGTTQSGVRASCRTGVALEDPKPAVSIDKDCLGRGVVLEMMACGMNGFALAALGDSPSGFFGGALMLGERKVGVKLGESTFSVLLDGLQGISDCTLQRRQAH